MTLEPASPGERSIHYASVATNLVLTILTCGIFNLFWNYRQMEACNELLGRDEFSFGMWILLSILTCGIYHFFYQYNMGLAINEIQRGRGLQITEGLPVLSVLAAIFGVGVVADCIHQIELNKIVS